MIDRGGVASRHRVTEHADIEGKIAAMLGADPRDVMIHDMAVNPMSKNIYLTVSRGRRAFTGQWQLPNDVANEIHTTIMTVCIPEAVVIARDLRLPPPIPIPQVTVPTPQTPSKHSGMDVA